MYAVTNTAPKADGRVVPWNKGKLIGLGIEVDDALEIAEQTEV